MDEIKTDTVKETEENAVNKISSEEEHPEKEEKTEQKAHKNTDENEAEEENHKETSSNDAPDDDDLRNIEKELHDQEEETRRLEEERQTEEKRNFDLALEMSKQLNLPSNKDLFDRYDSRKGNVSFGRGAVYMHIKLMNSEMRTSQDRLRILEASRNMLYKKYVDKDRNRPMLDLFDSSLYEIWSAYTEYLVADQAVTVEKKLIEAIISDRKTLTKIYDLLVK